MSASRGFTTSIAGKNVFWDLGFEHAGDGTPVETYALADELQDFSEKPDYLLLCVNTINVSVLMEIAALSQFKKILTFCDTAYFYSPVMRNALEALQRDGWQLSLFPQQIFYLEQSRP